MLSVTIAVLISLLNMAFAASVYLSLRGWLVPYEPSGMQLMLHLIITAPVVIGTTFWLFVLAKSGKCNVRLWKINLLGILIPVISLKTGITHFGFDKIGLVVACLIALALLLVFAKDVWRHSAS
jgi:hypothetical protein